MNFYGIVIGVVSFLIIGLCHPLVIKTEYYFGKKCWSAYLIVGIGCCVASLFIENVVASILIAVLAFSLFWGIKELFEQEKRVLKGWHPKNPKRTYPDEKK